MNLNDHCVICLEEGNLIKYNHCGKFDIHENCLNKWEFNDCIICRKKIIQDSEEQILILDTTSNAMSNTTSNAISDARSNYYYILSNMYLILGTLIIIAYLIFIFSKILHVRKVHGNYEFYFTF